jgi:hypothetical protein
LGLGLRLSRGFRDEQSGLLTRIATTENGSSCTPMKKLTAFLELERAVCIHVLTEQC